ncbi:MAG: lipopolysaccharide biosynthesis protein [Firmicutes bacterium]|nr:lipopolysaccharide biosynthesis protein [Bacillota bacterium]
MQEKNKVNVIKAFVWKYFERFSYQIIQFVVQIILARILFPEDYGVISIIMVFISISNVFIQNGFNMSLVQRKDVTDEDYSSVFTVGLILSVILYIIFYFASPHIAQFYNMPVLTNTFRVVSITLILGSLNSVQCAYLVRYLKYKSLFLSNLVSAVISGSVSITLALCDFGVWALVIQQLLYSCLSTVILFFVIEWKPRLILNFKRVKYLFSFGWKLLCSGLIEAIYNNVYELIIGKKFNETSLAYYSKGKQFPAIIVENINSSVSSVMLTVLSKIQDEKERMKELLKKSIVVSSTIMFPMMIGLLVVAKPLVSVLLTDKWLPCVPILQLLCISHSLMPIHTMNLQAINSLGRSDIYLKLEILKKICALLILLITIPFGIYAMVFGQIIISLISSFINSYPNKKLLNYGFIEQMKDILPIAIVSIVMGIIVYLISYLNLGSLTILCIQCIIGVLVYIALSSIFKLSGFVYLRGILKSKINKRKK